MKLVRDEIPLEQHLDGVCSLRDVVFLVHLYADNVLLYSLYKNARHSGDCGFESETVCRFAIKYNQDVLHSA